MGAPSLAHATGLQPPAVRSSDLQLSQRELQKAKKEAPDELLQQYSPIPPESSHKAQEPLDSTGLSVRQQIAAHNAKSPQHKDQQQQQHVQRRLFSGPGAAVNGNKVSPGLLPPAISPMQRGFTRQSATMQLAAMASQN